MNGAKDKSIFNGHTNGYSDGITTDDSKGSVNGAVNGHSIGRENGHAGKHKVNGSTAHEDHNDNGTNGSTRSWCEQSARGDEFIDEVLPRLLKQVLATYRDKDSRVVEFVQPEELQRILRLELTDEPVNNEDLEDKLKDVIKYSVKTGHRYFFNQLFGGIDTFALSGAILTEALNSSCYTYEVAPVGTLMEREIIQKIAKQYMGLPEGDGIFCPGGSSANMYSLSLARFNRFPESKVKGMQGLPPIHIYTSDLSHYSLKKAGFFLGFGLESIITIGTDEKGAMIPEELDQAIQHSKSQGYVPLMVNATAGTTVMGAYDPIEKIAEVCKKHGSNADSHIWLHVDGAWGGSVLLSPKLRHKMKGIHLADSLTWDPHKMTGAILQCAVFVTRHPELLAQAHSAKARYLFQQDKAYDTSFDTGDKSIQCGRKVDSIKLWVLWTAYGNIGMANRVEACFENALYLRDRIRATAGFRLLIDEPECTNVCFWYIPESLRGQTEDEAWWNKVSKVAPAIKAHMQTTGSMLVGYQPQGEFVNFFRMVIASSNSTKEDMDFVVDTISNYGELLCK